MVYSDFAWLVYILDQLLGNAAKYASKEQPQLKIWAGKESKEAEQVCLFIEDNGEGIKDSDIRRVFEKGLQDKITITENISQQEWGCIWCKKLQISWNIKFP